MTIISENILETQPHPGDDTVKSVTGDPHKGDGFYNRSDGLHTVQWTITNFIGTISVQATLSTSPSEVDWFTVSLGDGKTFSVDTTGLASQTSLKTISYVEPTSITAGYNFTGNYVWIRAQITNWTAGTVNTILMSH